MTELPRQTAILIGATGGSGTRALCHALRGIGVFMGVRLNDPGDAMDFEPILDDCINPVLRATKTLDYRVADLPAPLAREVTDRYRETALIHLRDRPAEAIGWGWKNPRSMFLLPCIAQVLPSLVFVHLVRDGRSMALSRNQNQVTKHFESLFGTPGDHTDRPGCIRLWATANAAVADWGARELADRYLRIRFEDLYTEPRTHLDRILAAAGLDGVVDPDRVASAAAAIRRPPDAERWRTLPPDEIAALERVAGPVLDRFGYRPAGGSAFG